MLFIGQEVTHGTERLTITDIELSTRYYGDMVHFKNQYEYYRAYPRETVDRYIRDGRMKPIPQMNIGDPKAAEIEEMNNNIQSGNHWSEGLDDTFTYCNLGGHVNWKEDRYCGECGEKL